MNCINDELVFKFNNDLLEKDQREEIQFHSATCEKCLLSIQKDKNFDLLISNSLKADNRVKNFSKEILERIKQKHANPLSLLGKVYVAGGIMWTIAVFNAIAVFWFVLHKCNYSFAKLFIGSKNILLSVREFSSFYSVYFKSVSLSLYVLLIFTFLMFIALRTMVLGSKRI